MQTYFVINFFILEGLFFEHVWLMRHRIIRDVFKIQCSEKL